MCYLMMNEFSSAAFAKTEHNGTVSSMAVTDAASVLSDKASQAAAAAASYPVINPYATLGNSVIYKPNMYYM